MKLEGLIKREISITIVTVILVAILFTAFSYAIFKVDAEGTPNTITFGDIALSFCVNEQCDEAIDNVDNVIGKKLVNGETQYVPIYPQKDPSTTEEWNALDPYIFKLKNTGSLSLYITLYLEKDTTSGLSYTYNTGSEEGFESTTVEYNTPVNDDQIKIAIGETVEGEYISPTIKTYNETAEEIGNETKHILTKNILIEAHGEKTFKLYAWLKEDAENSAQGKYFVTKISARGEYLPEELKPTSENG